MLPASADPASRPRRRWLFAVACALALTGAVALPAIPAAADNGEISFGQVAGDGSGNLTITVQSDFALANLTVHLWSGGSDTGTDVLDLTDFTDNSTFGFDTTQTYALANPSTDLAALPPGTYTATADATDTNTPTANSVSDQPLTGQFSFLAQPVVTLTDPTFTTSQPKQQVAIAGQVSSTCATLACPSGGWPVDTGVAITDVTASGQPSWTGSTNDTNGDFSVAGVTGIPGDQYEASVPAIPGMSLAATSAGMTQDEPELTPTSFVQPTATPAVFGQQTMTGTLEYQSGLQQIAVPAGVTIDATATPPGKQPVVVTTTTGSDGSFTMMLPAIFGTTSWQLSTADDLATTPFLAGTQATVSGTQLAFPATISRFTARVNKAGLLTVGGCLSSSDSGAPPDDPALVLQYRTSLKAGWKTLGSVSTMPMLGCAGAGFVAAGGEAAPRAYYRATFAGDTVYQPASSASVLAWLYQERYTSFSVTPHAIKSGAKITVKGTLQYTSGNGHWHAYAGQEVLIAYSGKASNIVWFKQRWVKTNKKGQFSFTFADRHGTKVWSVDYPGNKNHYPKWAPTVKVTVRGHVSAVRTFGPRPLTGDVMRHPVLLRSGWQFLLVAQPLVALLGA
jgi:hypothetical protein